MTHSWNDEDLLAFDLRNWSPDVALEQRNQLTLGAHSVAAIEACTIGMGLHALTLQQVDRAVAFFKELSSSDKEQVRFVPASGAASRMFSELRGSLSPAVSALLEQEGHRLPMLDPDVFAQVPFSQRASCIVAQLLGENSGWDSLPKGLIPFHQYADGSALTPFEEHANEWSQLAPDGRLHFTVPLAFDSQIKERLSRAGYSDVETSVQTPETDTLALDLASGALARDAEGGLLFRPGGHGALLHNLNALQSDYVFIRNIDNVVPAHRIEERNHVQRILGGEAFRLTEERDALIRDLLQENSGASERASEWLQAFMKNLPLSEIQSPLDWIPFLNRPIRLAGMVPNEGKAGGGPFWIQLANGHTALAIVEGAELEAGMLGEGTHFNPVDLCCSVADYHGTPFDLNEFAAHDMVFTAEKDWNGQRIRILERPGLWNGAMAHWLTRFIEVPARTFAPVKSVLDLLDTERWT